MIKEINKFIELSMDEKEELGLDVAGYIFISTKCG